VSDSTNRVVIFEAALTPATFWVKLDDLDLKQGASVKKLQLAGGTAYSGNAASHFVDATFFTFQDLSDVAPAK
jgi:choloylglycine hydrolase